MKKYNFLILILAIHLIFFSLCPAQTKNQILKYADQAFEEKNYYNANIYYKQLLEADDNQIKVKYKLAESMRLISDYQSAENYYAQVFNHNEGENFEESLFWLAMMQKQNGKYADARKNMELFNKNYKKEKEAYLNKKAKKEIESCEYALKNLDSNAFYIRNINKPVNTTNSEFAPFALNNEGLYFSALISKSDSSVLMEDSEKERIKIFRSGKENEQFESPKEIDENINDKNFDNANFSLSKELDLAFFSRTNLKGLSEIYYAEKDSQGKWQNISKLPESINHPEYTSTQPQICHFKGKNILFFASDRPGGFGKLDIWYSTVSIEKTSDKTTLNFKNPITLGKTVNSIDNEITPFYDEYSDSLYFSSDWHNGYGGYDIFKTTGNLDSLHTSINMGLPINSSANDYYFSAYFDKQEKNQKGYFSSNRKGAASSKGETCCNDIYYIEKAIQNTELPLAQSDTVIKKSVSTDKTKENIKLDNPSTALAAKKLNAFLPLTLYFHNDEPNPKSTKASTEINYNTAYLNYKALLSQYEKEYSKGLVDIKAKDAIVDINAFFNDFVDKGYQDLSAFSKTLKDLLESGHKIELVVKGYASPLAKSDYNVRLSKRRINSFKNYINDFEHGLLKKHIISKALIINEEPNGEFKSGSLVSDNINDLKNAIYSRSAGLERKIEINLKQISPPASDVLVDTKKEEQKNTTSNENIIISKPEIKVQDPFHDFGIINYGEKVSHKFIIKNTGGSDLLIYNAIGSCGCTVPEFSKAPIKPNEQGEIIVSFDSKGKFGLNKTSVTVITNGNPNTIKLEIAAEVIIKK